VGDAGPNLKHSVKCSFSTNGAFLNEPYAPVLGGDVSGDGFFCTEVAGHEGDHRAEKEGVTLDIWARVCDVADPDGFTFTEEAGHAGPHEARDSDGIIVYRVWSDPEPDDAWLAATCADVGPSGLFCTLPLDHGSSHIAKGGPNGAILDVWESEPELENVGSVHEARVEHLEKFSEDLIKLANELRSPDGTGAGAGAFIGGGGSARGEEQQGGTVELESVSRSLFFLPCQQRGRR
jgi:hypothetical protein